MRNRAPIKLYTPKFHRKRHRKSSPLTKIDVAHSQKAVNKELLALEK